MRLYRCLFLVASVVAGTCACTSQPQIQGLPTSTNNANNAAYGGPGSYGDGPATPFPVGSGSGFGTGSGYGSGYGTGSGYGSGYGTGYGTGSGYATGYGTGHGTGYGTGTLASTGVTGSATSTSVASGAGGFVGIQALVAADCGGASCHGAGSPQGDFSSEPGWDNACQAIISQLNGGTMPPSGQLAANDKASFLQYCQQIAGGGASGAGQSAGGLGPSSLGGGLSSGPQQGSTGLQSGPQGSTGY